MDNFLKTYSPPELNQEETDNSNRPISRSETESVILKTPHRQKSRARWLYRQILPNIKGRTYTNPPQTLPKDWRRKNTPKDILLSHHHPATKTRQRHYQKKWQASIFDEYRCKTSQQNISKSNPTTHKIDHTSQPDWIHPRVTRMVQHMQINVIHHINKRKGKNHMIISVDAGKAFDKIQHPLMIKTLTKVCIEGTYLNIIKAIYDKPAANIILNSENLNAFPLKPGTRQGCPLLSLLFNIWKLNIWKS